MIRVLTLLMAVGALLGGLDRIVINDYRNFASAVGVLLN